MTSDDRWLAWALSQSKSADGCRTIIESQQSKEILNRMVGKACSGAGSDMPKDLVELLRQMSMEEKLKDAATWLVEIGVFDQLLGFCRGAGANCEFLGTIFEVILSVANVCFTSKKGTQDLWLLLTSEQHFFALSDEQKMKLLNIPCSHVSDDNKWKVLNGIAMALTYKRSDVRTASNRLVYKLVSEWRSPLEAFDGRNIAASFIEKLCVALACCMDGQEDSERIMKVLLILMMTTDGPKAKDIVRKYLICTDTSNQQYHVLNIVKRMGPKIKNWTPQTMTCLLNIIFVLLKWGYPRNESSDRDTVMMFVDLVRQMEVSEWLTSQFLEKVMQLIMTCLGQSDSIFLDELNRSDASDRFGKRYDPDERFRERYDAFKRSNPPDYTISSDTLEGSDMSEFNAWLDSASQEPDPVKDKRVRLKIQVKGTEIVHEFPSVSVNSDLGYVEWRLNEYRGDFSGQSMGSSESNSKLSSRLRVIEDRMKLIDHELGTLWDKCKERWQENEYMNFTRMHELFGILNQRLNIASYTPYGFQVMKLVNDEWKVENQIFHTNDCIQDVMMLHSSTQGFSPELRLLAIPGAGSLQRHFPIICAPKDRLMESYRRLQCNPEKSPTSDKKMKKKDVLFPLLFSDEERQNFAVELLEAERSRADSRSYSLYIDKGRAIQDFPIIFDYFVYGCRKVCFHYGNDAQDSNHLFLEEVAKVLTGGALSNGVWRKHDTVQDQPHSPLANVDTVLVDDGLFPMPYAQPTTMKLFGKLCALALLLRVKLPFKLAPAFVLLVQRLPVPSSEIPGINLEALVDEAVNKEKFVYEDKILGTLELRENGASDLVTRKNMEEYKTALADLYTGRHISGRFVKNFRNGFAQVLPIEILDIIPATGFNAL